MANINECIKVNDTIKGFFTVIDDSTGKVIISKHNTITLDGRKYIYSKFYGSGSTITFSNNNGNNKPSEYSFNSIVFCDGNYTMTTDNMTYLDIENTIDDNLTLNISMSDFVEKATDSDISISVTKKLVNTNNENTSYKFNSICILLDKNTDASTDGGTRVLFSRVTIDDVYLSPNRTYTLTYSIYF